METLKPWEGGGGKTRVEPVLSLKREKHPPSFFFFQKKKKKKTLSKFICLGNFGNAKIHVETWYWHLSL